LLHGKPQLANPPRKILLQDGYRLGDLLLLSHALKHLRASYPLARIDLIALPAGRDFLRNSGWVDSIIPFKAPWAFRNTRVRDWLDCLRHLRKEHYDLAIDFRGDPRGTLFLYAAGIPRRISFSDFGAAAFCSRCYATPQLHVHQMHRSLFLAQQVSGSGTGIADKPLWPRLSPFPNAEPASALSLSGYRFWKTETGPRIVIHACTSNPRKQWPLERFARLIDNLHNQGMQVILVGEKGEREFLKTLAQHAGNTCGIELPSFEELGQIVSSCSLVICLDSFVQHVSWALGKKTIVIYGAGTPSYTAPLSPDTAVIWNNRPLSPPYREWDGPVPADVSSEGSVLTAVHMLLGTP
jgi:ADP-heptose:LPS heptosyltransferase